MGVSIGGGINEAVGQGHALDSGHRARDAGSHIFADGMASMNEKMQVTVFGEETIDLKIGDSPKKACKLLLNIIGHRVVRQALIGLNVPLDDETLESAAFVIEHFEGRA